MGLECPNPGIFTLNNNPSPVRPSNLSGRTAPSLTPEAKGPRKDGQFSVAGLLVSAPPAEAMEANANKMPRTEPFIPLSM